MNDIRQQHVETSSTHHRGSACRSGPPLSADVHPGCTHRLDAGGTDFHRQGQRVGRTLCQTQQEDEEEEDKNSKTVRQDRHKEKEGEKSQKEGIQVESSDQRTARSSHHESDDLEKSDQKRVVGKKVCDGTATTERQVGGRTISQQENHIVEFIETDTHVKITSRGCCKQ